MKKLYYGNQVYEDGRIYNAIGDKIAIKDGIVRLYINGKKRTLLAGRVVYEAFTGKEIPKGYVIKFRDGDKNNASYQNVEVIDRKTFFDGHVWECKFTKEEKEQIRKEYDATNPKQHGFKRGNERPSYVDLAKKYGCSKSTIIKIIKEKG